MDIITLASSSSYEPVDVPDETRNLGLKDCVYPAIYDGHFTELLIAKREIVERTKSLANLIHDDYAGKQLAMLCVLKGSGPFFHLLLDCLQELRHPYTMDFLRVSSYDGTKTTGTVKISGGLSMSRLRGRHVIVVEDIIDTGTTLSHLLPILEKEGKPKSLETCSLIIKRLKHPAKASAKYAGFTVPDRFIVGFGLDYNELYRDLPDIYEISQKGIDFDPQSIQH